MSRELELTAEEHAARQVCKILGAGSLDGEGLRSRWLAIQQETSARSRSGVDEHNWNKVLEGAVSRGWIAERDGQFFATEYGRLIASAAVPPLANPEQRGSGQFNSSAPTKASISLLFERPSGPFGCVGQLGVTVSSAGRSS
jgi:hypothetical protein